VHIDQGYQSPIVTVSTVRDVEPGAWAPGAAVDRFTWNADRPTIYCNQATLPDVLAAGWRGDLWVAIIGWLPGDPWPAPVQAAIDAGCNVVAVQNAQNVNGTYDQSVVLDPAWPNLPNLPNQGDPMPIAIGATGVTEIYLLDGGKMSHIPDPASLQALVAAGVKQVTVTPAALTQFLADFPPGTPSVTVGTVSFPTYTSTPSA
jgi:hypothetical protein